MKRRRQGIVVDDTTWTEIQMLVDRYSLAASLDGVAMELNGDGAVDDRATSVL